MRRCDYNIPRQRFQKHFTCAGAEFHFRRATLPLAVLMKKGGTVASVGRGDLMEGTSITAIINRIIEMYVYFFWQT